MGDGGEEGAIVSVRERAIGWERGRGIMRAGERGRGIVRAGERGRGIMRAGEREIAGVGERGGGLGRRADGLRYNGGKDLRINPFILSLIAIVSHIVICFLITVIYFLFLVAASREGGLGRCEPREGVVAVMNPHSFRLIDLIIASDRPIHTLMTSDRPIASHG